MLHVKTELTGAHSIPHPSTQPVKNRPSKSSALKLAGLLQECALVNDNQPIKLGIADIRRADFLPTMSTAQPATSPPNIAPIGPKACSRDDGKEKKQYSFTFWPV